MTLVTNLSGLPFSRGIIAAVYLRPSDLQLWGAARLEITLPAGIDRRELVAYRFETNGTRFTGMPSQILTNRIVIPITELGGYGVSLATAQEMTAFFAQAVAAAAPIVALTGRTLAAVAPDECDPDKKRVADEARREISRAMDARSNEIARRLSVSRQQQLAGMESDQAQIFADALRQSCQLYNDLIAPRWGEARQNCALSKVLAGFTLGMERQRQLMGVSDAESCASLSTVADCALYQNCVEEIRDCCRRGSRRRDRIIAALSIIRQTQLLGIDCISDQLFQEVVDGCSSNVWNGTFSAVEDRSSSENRTTIVSPTTTIIETFTEAVRLEFHGQVVESQEIDFGQFGKSVNLIVIGDFSARDYSMSTYSYSGRCPGGAPESVYRIAEDEDVDSRKTAYDVRIMIDPNNNYTLTGLNVPHPDLPPVAGTRYDFDYQRTLPCQGSARTDTSRLLDEVSLLGPVTPLIQKLGSTNQVAGVHVVDQPQFNPPGKTTFRWDFQRRRVTGQ